jgi:hypothetical protein
MNTPTNAAADTTLLAAVERAERHQTRPDTGVPIWTILDHLDIRKRTAAARHIRTRLAELQTTDQLLHGKRNGIETWTLTAAGHEQLTASRDAGELAELPESPQHRTWRNARTTATQEITRFRDELTDELEAALALLHDAHDSDSLYALAEHLNHNIKRLASATHCAHEWQEPNDTTTDIDTRTQSADQEHEPAEQQRRYARRQGRRNMALWSRAT